MVPIERAVSSSEVVKGSFERTSSGERSVRKGTQGRIQFFICLGWEHAKALAALLIRLGLLYLLPASLSALYSSGRGKEVGRVTVVAFGEGRKREAERQRDRCALGRACVRTKKGRSLVCATKKLLSPSYPKGLSFRIQRERERERD